MRRRTLDLTPSQRRELAQVRDRDHRAYLREIAAALLKVADGQPALQVAEHGLLRRRSSDTVYRWLNTYQQHGIAGLVHRPRGHRGYSPRRGRAVAAGGAAAS